MQLREPTNDLMSIAETLMIMLDARATKTQHSDLVLSNRKAVEIVEHLEKV
ncbi:MAG: hypothetical protein HC781_07095 [Leptolyngbyaceae cyanobacterium CSU_1_4]|nr:hypothetical protein [Leptolyngbyaceae cyanobacterium CSU_1_4]